MQGSSTGLKSLIQCGEDDGKCVGSTRDQILSAVVLCVWDEEKYLDVSD